MARQTGAWNRLSSYRTMVASQNGNTVVTYVTTPIVEFDAENIILRSGGYETVTTKRKMNQAARQFGLGYCVFQKDHEWFVQVQDKTVPFFDGIQIERVA